MKVLIPTDFSKTAQNATEYAINFFGSDAEYRLLNSYPLVYASTGTGSILTLERSLKASAEFNLDEEIKRLKSLFGDITVEKETYYGYPDRAIKNVAEKLRPDVLVMGTQGSKSLSNILTGTMASKIVGNSQTPIIVVPRDYKWVKPHRIAFAADFKEVDNITSLAMLKQAAIISGADLFIVHVEQPDTDDDCGPEKWAIDTYLRDVEHTFITLRDNHVVKALQVFAQENEIDMLAVLARKENKWQQLMANSKADRLAGSSPVPILALNEQSHLISATGV